MSYALGIDLGTTYSAAAVSRRGTTEVVSLGYQASVVASVAYVTPDGDVLVGEPALRRGLTEPSRLAREFKRRMGDSVPLIVGGAPWSAEALTARLLRWIVGVVEEQQGGPPDRVALTYPANWGPFKQERLVQAWRIAGLDEVASLTEPEAAAMAYAAVERVPDGQVVAVYDLGGGTFDAAVLRKTEGGFEVLGTPEGIERLGGVDVDEAVLAYVQRHIGGPPPDADDGGLATAQARLRADCVEAKEALSADTQVSIPVLLPHLHTEVRLTRSELETMVKPQLLDSVTALRRSISSAGLTPEQVDRVLLVGGASRMPLVGRLVSEELGRPFFVDAHPKHAVALGAAGYAARLAGGAPDGAGSRGVAGGAAPLVVPESRRSEGPAEPPEGGGRPPDVPSEQQVPDGGAPTGGTPIPGTPGGSPPVDPPPTEPLPVGRPRGQATARGWIPAALVALVALGALAGALVLLRGGDGSEGSGGPGSTTSSVTTEGGPPDLEVVGATPVGDLPDGIVADGDDLWVASTFADTVYRLDAATGEVELQVPVDGEPLAVVVAEGSVWVTQRAADTVARLDPADGALLATIDAPGEPTGIAAGAGAVWVAGVQGPFTRIDPATDTAAVVGDFPRGTGVAVEDGEDGTVWVPHSEDLVAAVDPTSGEVLQEITAGASPDVAVVAPSGLWVANRQGGTVTRIDPVAREVTATVPVGTAPAGLAADGDRIWVVDNEEGTLVLVDGPSAEVVGSVEVGGAPLGVAAGGDRVWVTASGADEVVRVDVSPP